MKTLVIGDIHEKVRWIEDVIKKEAPDEVVLLGDYFDSFVSTHETATQTAEWLVHSVKQPNRHHIFGNHDLWYRFPVNDKLICSGNTMDKCKLLGKIIQHKTWEKLTLFYFSQNFLFSHAGISKHHFDHPVLGITLETIQKECDKAMDAAYAGGVRASLRAGWSRGGDEKVGGIDWQDFDTEFRPITGWNQMVGHTPHWSTNGKGIIKYSPNKKNSLSTNYCVDFCGKYYTLIENGKVKFKETGVEDYNKREHALVGEPFIDGRKIIELDINSRAGKGDSYGNRWDDDNQSSTQPVVQPMNPNNTQYLVVPDVCKACGEPLEADGTCHHTHRID